MIGIKRNYSLIRREYVLFLFLLRIQVIGETDTNVVVHLVAANVTVFC